MRKSRWGKFQRESRVDRKLTSGHNISFSCGSNYSCESLPAKDSTTEIVHLGRIVTSFYGNLKQIYISMYSP